jgi:hypothetical protein
VLDAGVLAHQVEEMGAGGFAFGLARLVDGEAVGELGAVVGEDGVHRTRELGEEALEERGRGSGVAASMDFDPRLRGDKHSRPRGPVDGDEDVGFAPLQRWQVLQVDPRLREGQA